MFRIVFLRIPSTTKKTSPLSSPRGTTTTCLSAMTMMMSRPFTTLVVGATGATGRHVVRQLLEQQHEPRVGSTAGVAMVICLVRSRTDLLQALEYTTCPAGLVIYEGTVLELSDEKLQPLIENVDAIVCCLGHTFSVAGIWGSPRRLVTDSIARLVQAIQQQRRRAEELGLTKTKTTMIKVLLMSSDGVYIPHMDDPSTSWSGQFAFCLLRCFLPPHADNEAAAAYLLSLPKPATSKDDDDDYDDEGILIRWVIVRPTELLHEATASGYQLFDQPPPGGVLFGTTNFVSRINVATFMVQLLTDEKLFHQYQFTCPVIHNKKDDTADTTTAAPPTTTPPNDPNDTKKTA
jgi:NAD(P)H-binding